MTAAAKVKAMLENLSAEELDILQLQRRNEGESEFALNTIRKNQQFLVRRLRAVQLLKIGQIATIIDPQNPNRRLVRFVVPRAPVEVVHRNSTAMHPTLRGPYWRPAANKKKGATRVVQ